MEQNNQDTFLFGWNTQYDLSVPQLIYTVYFKPKRLGRKWMGMNDQQSEEMIKQLQRIADALERFSQPQIKEPALKDSKE